MCLATPLQLTKIEKSKGTVEHDGKEFPVDLQLIPKAKVGDWILTHGELAINIVPEAEALDILKLIAKANQG
jgi:hydrogenase expression/formation protein HypC